MKYTKGPWLVEIDVDKRTLIVTAEGGFRGDTDRYFKERENAAKLIAKAPEMYEALEYFKFMMSIDYSKSRHDVPRDIGFVIEEMDKKCRRILAEIEKVPA